MCFLGGGGGGFGWGWVFLLLCGFLWGFLLFFCGGVFLFLGGGWGVVFVWVWGWVWGWFFFFGGCVGGVVLGVCGWWVVGGSWVFFFFLGGGFFFGVGGGGGWGGFLWVWCVGVRCPPLEGRRLEGGRTFRGRAPKGGDFSVKKLRVIPSDAPEIIIGCVEKAGGVVVT